MNRNSALRLLEGGSCGTCRLPGGEKLETREEVGCGFRDRIVGRVVGTEVQAR